MTNYTLKGKGNDCSSIGHDGIYKVKVQQKLNCKSNRNCKDY